jgi:hypothetical protein
LKYLFLLVLSFLLWSGVVQAAVQSLSPDFSMVGSFNLQKNTILCHLELQQKYNQEHNITPRSVQKAIAERLHDEAEAETADVKALDIVNVPRDELEYLERQLTEQMELAAQNLQFEKAAELRDQITEITDVLQSKKIHKKR